MAAPAVLLLIFLFVDVRGIDEEIALHTYLGTISNSLYARPVKTGSEKVKVNLTFFLDQVLKVQPKSVTLCGTIFSFWNDERLKWNPASYAGVALTRYSVANLWTIGYFAVNGAGTVQDIVADTQNDQVSLLYDGVVYYQQRLCFETVCSMNMQEFPEDSHTCQLLLGVLGYDDTQVELSAEASYDGLSTYVNSTEWTLNSWATEKSSINLKMFGSTSIKVPQYVFNVTVTRKSKYFATMITYPVVTLSFISLLCFLIPVESGEKIGFAISVLLSFTFYVLIMDNFLPKNNSQPWLNIFLLIVFGISCLSMHATAVVLRIYHKNANHTRPSRWAFVIFIKRLGMLVAHFGCCRYRKAPKRADEVEKTEKMKKHSENLSAENDEKKESEVTEKYERHIKRNSVDVKENNKKDPEVAVKPKKSKHLKWKVIDKEEEWRLMASILDKALMCIGLLIICVCAIIFIGIFA